MERGGALLAACPILQQPRLDLLPKREFVCSNKHRNVVIYFFMRRKSAKTQRMQQATARGFWWTRPACVAGIALLGQDR